MNLSPTMQQRGLKSANILAANKPCGTRLRYLGGCHCALCRAANTAYATQRARAVKNGEWNGLVPSSRAQMHLLKLSAKGVGRRAVQASTDIGASIIQKIYSGEKKKIRAMTEKKILRVTIEQASPASLVSAKSSWKLLNVLLSKGYTKTQLANFLGGKSLALQVSHDKILLRTEARIKKLFARCEANNFTDAKKYKPAEVLPANTYRTAQGVLVHRMGDEE
jgi:hypothetical protein